MLPAPPDPERSLLARPQRLGVMPTGWFWNDPERQLLLRPLILAVVVPLAPLLLWLQIALELDVWPTIAAMVVVPVLLMGLVERHVRRQLVRRAGEIPVPEDRPPPSERDALAVLLPMWIGMAAAFALAYVTGFGLHGSSFLLVASAGALAGLALAPRRRAGHCPQLPPGPRE